MGLQDLSTCVGAYHCDTAGYDAANTRITDQTAYGNHLDLVTGTPVFTTRDGFECLDMDNTFWFEGDSPLLPRGSYVAVFVANLPGSDGTTYPISTASPRLVNDDFDGVPTGLSDADWLSSAYQRRTMRVLGATVSVHDRVGQNVSNVVSLESMALVTGAFPADPAVIQAALNGAAASSSPGFNNDDEGSRTGSRLRIGQLKSTAITAGRYFALKRLYFFAGNVFDHASFDTERAAEMATWGIV